ncbi:MAG: D-alanyl-D-alanine carboxypeptidase [Lachnospiraceae bacterium]|nr:D-alanyl-D-alanine carboxypeptidase [Lachnospiraceae bacterium]
MKAIKRIIIGIICVCCAIATILPEGTRVSASTRMPENIRVSVIGGAEGTVRALNAGYDNNIYISLRDTAVLLAGTQCPINLDINGGSAKIITGEPYSDELDHSGFTEEQLKQAPGGDPGSSALFVNEDERRYYTFILDIGGAYDCFISPSDLAMILDIEMECDENGDIAIDPSRGFTINPARMESFDYFDGFNTVVVGDATTGEVFYGYNYEQPFPIASTTKLMTYLLTMDAISSGKITMDDKVVISQKAADISASSDGFVAMSSGWEVPVSELILGALLPSSNECALALGEYIGGSEDAFVKMMNEKAAGLGLKTAIFHNPNGLPIFSDTVIPAKTQNKMSGYDMFRMCAHILNTYPQVKEITSLKTARMDTLKKELKNTNGLLYNMPEVNGLKTGTTDRSGACLITSLTVPASDGPHDLLVVALGAENSQARLQVSELMARYGMKVLKGEAAKISYSMTENDENKEEKITSESIVRLVVDHALRK